MVKAPTEEEGGVDDPGDKAPLPELGGMEEGFLEEELAILVSDRLSK